MNSLCPACHHVYREHKVVRKYWKIVKAFPQEHTYTCTQQHALLCCSTQCNNSRSMFFNRLNFRCSYKFTAIIKEPPTVTVRENLSHYVFKWRGLYSKAFESSQACKMLLILLSDTTQLFCFNKQTHDESLSLCWGGSVKRHSHEDHLYKINASVNLCGITFVVGIIWNKNLMKMPSLNDDSSHYT